MTDTLNFYNNINNLEDDNKINLKDNNIIVNDNYIRFNKRDWQNASRYYHINTRSKRKFKDLDDAYAETGIPKSVLKRFKCEYYI